MNRLHEAIRSKLGYGLLTLICGDFLLIKEGDISSNEDKQFEPNVRHLFGKSEVQIKFFLFQE